MKIYSHMGLKQKNLFGIKAKPISFENRGSPVDAIINTGSDIKTWTGESL